MMKQKVNMSKIAVKRILSVIMLAAMILSYCGICSIEVYAALPKIQEISEESYYGKSALRNMSNSNNLVYAYEQIAEGVKQSQVSIPIKDDTHSITAEELKTVFEAYINDYPQHFWRQNGYSYSYSGYIVTRLSPSYTMAGDELEEAKEKFNNGIDEVITGIDASNSEFERELVIHDRLAERIEYVSTAEYAHDAYGAVVDGKAVCEGYARAFQYALYKVGILSVTVTGDAGGAHAWNLVRIDGQYYYVDLTWDDQTSRTYHAYFNLPLSEMSSDHTVESKIALPECNSWEANYFTIFGGRLDSGYTIQDVAALLNKNLTADFYITTGAEEFWSWFKENVRDIAAECGVTGGFSYGYSSMGKERIVYISNATRTITNVTEVDISESAHTLNSEGETFILTASVKPDNANNKTITFESDNTDVAIVNKYTGKVTAVGKGKANITAVSEDGGKKAICVVTVNIPITLGASITVNGSGDSAECKVGDSVVVNANAIGGSEVYTYRYDMKAGGKTYILKDYSSAASYTGRITTPGTKEFIVYVKDSTGTIAATNTVTVTAEPADIVSSLKVNGSMSVAAQKVGDSVVLTAAATGGSGNYTYRYEMKAGGKTYILKDYSSSSSYTGKLTTTGTKEFVVYVKDSNGTVSTSNIVKVEVENESPLTAGLKINGGTSDVCMTVGNSVTLKATAIGGNGNYKYKYVMKNVTTGVNYTLKNYSDSTEYTGKLTTTGAKEFIVYVMDSSGTEVASNRIVAEVSSASTLTAGLQINRGTSDIEASVGNTVVLNALASGGDKSYTYKYVMKNVVTGVIYTLKNYSDSTEYIGKLTTTGAKEFMVYVKDLSGTIITSNTITVTVK